MKKIIKGDENSLIKKEIKDKDSSESYDNLNMIIKNLQNLTKNLPLNCDFYNSVISNSFKLIKEKKLTEINIDKIREIIEEAIGNSSHLILTNFPELISVTLQRQKVDFNTNPNTSKIYLNPKGFLSKFSTDLNLKRILNHNKSLSMKQQIPFDVIRLMEEENLMRKRKEKVYSDKRVSNTNKSDENDILVSKINELHLKENSRIKKEDSINNTINNSNKNDINNSENDPKKYIVTPIIYNINMNTNNINLNNNYMERGCLNTNSNRVESEDHQEIQDSQDSHQQIDNNVSVNTNLKTNQKASNKELLKQKFASNINLTSFVSTVPNMRKNANSQKIQLSSSNLIKHKIINSSKNAEINHGPIILANAINSVKIDIKPKKYNLEGLEDNKPIRNDRLGNEIIKKSKNHKVTFKDKVENNKDLLIDVEVIENFKRYNSLHYYPRVDYNESEDEKDILTRKKSKERYNCCFPNIPQNEDCVIF